MLVAEIVQQMETLVPFLESRIAQSESVVDMAVITEAPTTKWLMTTGVKKHKVNLNHHAPFQTTASLCYQKKKLELFYLCIANGGLWPENDYDTCFTNKEIEQIHVALTQFHLEDYIRVMDLEVCSDVKQLIAQYSVPSIEDWYPQSYWC